MYCKSQIHQKHYKIFSHECIKKIHFQFVYSKPEISIGLLLKIIFALDQKSFNCDHTPKLRMNFLAFIKSQIHSPYTEIQTSHTSHRFTQVWQY